MTDCKLTEEDRAGLVETTGLTREQINKFAENFRSRNEDITERLSKIDGEDPETVHSASPAWHLATSPSFYSLTQPGDLISPSLFILNSA